MNSKTGDSIIEVRDLTKRYGQSVACDAINLSIREGMTFGLLGPNGAGKSTFIRMLMGLTAVDAGDVLLFGENASERSTKMRSRIGYVPELHFIYRWMTVNEVLVFVSRLYDSWDANLADNLLSKFELSPKKRVSALSKGMAAKLGLIIALAHNPDLLILDEPTSGLDPVIREDFLESVLQSHACKGRTILFSKFADRKDVVFVVVGREESQETLDAFASKNGYRQPQSFSDVTEHFGFGEYRLGRLVTCEVKIVILRFFSVAVAAYLHQQRLDFRGEGLSQIIVGAFDGSSEQQQARRTRDERKPHRS